MTALVVLAGMFLLLGVAAFLCDGTERAEQWSAARTNTHTTTRDRAMAVNPRRWE